MAAAAPVQPSGVNGASSSSSSGGSSSTGAPRQIRMRSLSELDGGAAALSQVQEERLVAVA
jgi:hypothetical protein